MPRLSNYVPKGRVPVEELEQLAEWTLLLDSHKRFITHYIQNGYNMIEAVNSSFPNVKKRTSARVMGQRILHNHAVTLILFLHQGDDPREAFCRMLAKMVIRGSISREQLDGFRLLADIREFNRPYGPFYEKGVLNAVRKKAQAESKRKSEKNIKTELQKDKDRELLAEFNE